MEHGILREEVQRIDGTPESVFDALALIVEELDRPDFEFLPKSVEYAFFEEFYKCLIEWMGRGETDSLQSTFKKLKEVIKNDKDGSFASPFSGIGSKRRFGAYLTTVTEMIEIYLRSDLELKDTINIMGDKANSQRYRQLLSALYDLGQTQFTVSQVMGFDMYKGKYERMVERDLGKLEEFDFISREGGSTKPIRFRLTTRAWYNRKNILEQVSANREKNPAMTRRELVEKIRASIDTKGLAKKLTPATGLGLRDLEIRPPGEFSRDAFLRDRNPREAAMVKLAAFCASKDYATADTLYHS
jgi:hypothetical protein